MKKILLSISLFFICLSAIAQTQYVISGDVTYSGEVHGHSKITIDSNYVTADWDNNGIQYHKRFQYSSYSASVDALSLEIISSTNKDDNLFCFNGTLGFTCDNEFHLSVFKENDETFIRLLSAAYNRTGIFAQFKLATKDHEYVDLGLSVMWATCNVGATKPEDYGDFFAWGETKPKDKYFWSNLKYCNDSDGESFSKYNHNKPGTKDNKVRLELKDDAARANWGGSWRMPTYLEFEELLTRCNWVWTTMNGVRGYKVTSRSNGNSIFLPATGYHIGAGYFMNGQCSSYWSANITNNNSGDAWNVLIDENGHKLVDGRRHCGSPVRPVFFGTHENNNSNTQSENVTPTNSNTYSPSEKVYSSTEVDVAPKFNGGDMGEFTKWVNQNVVYPDIAKQYDIKGRVITKFTIHSNGQISDIQILKGVDSSLDKEAINVLKKAPALTPAKKGGENVAVSYMLPIDFGR